ncbi:helix-turn-helix domain-containing protein [Achromobacter xylosoxidans]|uniref:helix-turn-helix domain-containing protein n=1 Tax=Alcaligenes xylosoxydans xylosoxydans TaxID=85698 RepID=UPI00389A9E1F
MDTATDLIKRLRGAGLSQTEISRRTGIPQPRLSRWEAGFPSTGANDALKLAQLVRDTGAAGPGLASSVAPSEPAHA